ncbi:PqqD family protein [Aquirufa sp. ROCK2-A2]
MNYILNKVDLSKEIFDNEAVIINIPSGKYYSVNSESGVVVLRLLENATNKEQICEYLMARYDCSAVDLSTQVTAFLESLLVEKIIIEISEKEQATTDISISTQAFKPLLLEIYDDMQELIELDPVHDVTASKGWPNKK